MGDHQFPEIPMILKPVTEEAKEEAKAVVGFKWAKAPIGKRNKLGGAPDWLQAAATPDCPGCNDAMTFYGQLDSVGDDMCLADVGMIYVFICLGCFEAKNIFQSG
jgi:hypothetical protein